MNIYHFIVIAIIAVALGVPAYRFPHRGFLFQVAVGAAIALVLAAVLVLIVYLSTRGEA